MVVRRVARPLLASIFLVGGADAAQHPASKVDGARILLCDWTPPGTHSTEQVVQTDGIVKVGAGLLFALGRAPRLSALILAGTQLPSTLARHRFWEETDPAKRKAQL